MPKLHDEDTRGDEGRVATQHKKHPWSTYAASGIELAKQLPIHGVVTSIWRIGRISPFAQKQNNSPDNRSRALRVIDLSHVALSTIETILRIRPAGEDIIKVILLAGDGEIPHMPR